MERNVILIVVDCASMAPLFTSWLCILIYYITRTHYKDYLVTRIKAAKLDPVDMMSVEKLKQLIEREELRELPKGRFEFGYFYHQRLKNVSCLVIWHCIISIVIVYKDSATTLSTKKDFSTIFSNFVIDFIICTFCNCTLLCD